MGFFWIDYCKNIERNKPPPAVTLFNVLGAYSLFARSAYLRVKPRSGEWIHCFNLLIPFAYNASRLTGTQLGLRLTAYVPQCTHIWTQDGGSPRKWRNCNKRIGMNTVIWPQLAWLHVINEMQWSYALLSSHKLTDWQWLIWDSRCTCLLNPLEKGSDWSHVLCRSNHHFRHWCWPGIVLRSYCIVLLREYLESFVQTVVQVAATYIIHQHLSDQGDSHPLVPKEGSMEPPL